ncbi:pentapeptide repeat-containing protein [Emticicia sp. BO119]|uniref:pentapeptide repeat-containing protein n=1 Tax=Emticicia sp. BO119 TaxID=2757768 RepID=UPI0015F0276C|nr:pentapeptide repeat-containing protein [Emticicia sp. BO119]MBA4853075.1 pentapeptide repeat-containing protein [Emticicia sp. BO119]
MSLIDIDYSKNIITVKDVCIDNSIFENVSVQNLFFNDVNLSGTRITNANMSNIEIEGAGLGGAYIHNIGVPPEGHPAYDPDAKHPPVRFENCDFEASTIIDCNLTNVAVKDCNLKGMTINGILVETLLENFTQQK